jgi:hypothetical protein
MTGNQDAFSRGFGKGFAVDFVGGIGGVLLAKGEREFELSPSMRSRKSAIPSSVVPNQRTGPANCFSQ